MSLSLPEVDRRPLARAPLAVTALQLRYEQNLAVGDGDTGLLIHEQLGGRDGQYPRVEERLGLRYINRIVEADVILPADFQGIIADELLGPVANSFWRDGVSGLQQQIELDVTDEIKSVIRHGTLPRTTGYGIEAYLLDIDVFRQQPRRFDINGIAETVDVLNNAATALFQTSLTSEYLDRLRQGDAA